MPVTPPSKAFPAVASAAAGIAVLFLLLPGTLLAAEPQSAIEAAWWVWVLLLFVFSFVLGIFAVLAGVGGGVLFVPIVSSFFPFHLDFVRGRADGRPFGSHFSRSSPDA